MDVACSPILVLLRFFNQYSPQYVCSPRKLAYHWNMFSDESNKSCPYDSSNLQKKLCQACKKGIKDGVRENAISSFSYSFKAVFSCPFRQDCRTNKVHNKKRIEKCIAEKQGLGKIQT